MAQGLKTIILGIIITLASNQVVSKLPYEVLDTIVELSDFDDFRGLNRVNVSDEQGPTRPIYRLDLDPGYVAYYEIDTGDDYVLLSSGPKTGDFREVESGPDPRPTNLLILQAQSNGQKCEKFFRLSPTGLTVCKNHNGTVVAASYNWTADVAKIDDWRMLDQMVRTSLKNFQNKWVERAKDKQIILDWATTDFVHKGQKLKKQTDEEALSPGSIVKVALGERFKSVKVFITSYAKSRYSNRVIRPTPKSKWQRKLCKVLVDVCLEESSKVNPFVLKKTPNNLFYLKLEINGNSNFVWKELEGHEVGFVISIQKEHDSIMKHFAISLHSGRFGRSPPGSGNKKIPGSDYDMPDYDQHKCCGCLSGCSPVAWAQVFGYYDRRARYSSSIFSPQIYGDSSEVAPKTLTREVRSFVEDIRKQVKTYCGSNGGATKTSKMGDIAPWFRARQGAKARVVSYLRGWWLWGYSTSKIRSKGKWWLDKGYPVVFSIKLENKAGHSVVATKYRTKSRRYRHCVKILFWTSCSWKTAHDDKFYLHYGWGGSNNKWDHVNPYSAHVAYITK